jgi:hypothetical protein
LLTIATLLWVSTATNATTSEDQLFTCTGELIGMAGSYDIVETWLLDRNDVVAMKCAIDERVLRRVLSVCHVGDLCVVSAKGESGNDNQHVIQKVFDVQRQPASRVQERQQALGAAATLSTANVGATYLRGCFSRVYDRAHLARHPDQIITAVTLEIYPSPSDPDQTWFAIQETRRIQSVAQRGSL